MRIFLDANVIFTATHNPRGKSAFIIELGVEGYFEVVTCQLAIEEARRNLELKYPHSAKQLSSLLKRVKVVPTILIGKCPIRLPNKDEPIMLSAISSQSTHLITGDLRDFGKFMNRPQSTAGVIITTPAEFLLNKVKM